MGETKEWVRAGVGVELEYLGHGRYALYIDGELHGEYANFMEAVEEYEEMRETLGIEEE